MQEIENIVFLKGAIIDLEEGRKFYNRAQKGIGEYFYDSLISDIESLYLYAGIHPCYNSFYYMFSRRFPFAIYYTLNHSNAIIVAILDMRSNPAWVHHQLHDRKQ
jgi:hypothetical protein